jgi:uncharacterized protein (TIGR02600 family)
MRTRWHGRRWQAARGSAIVILLVFVAMIMVLVLAVLGTGMQTRRQSVAVGRTQEVDALSQLPAQIVITQLQRATLPGTTADGERLTWVSQPGMIRVFGTQPQARMYYRLYSAPVMNSTTLDLAQEAAALSQWNTQTAGCTDLNEPAVGTRNGTVEKRFPIADPAAIGRVAGFTLRQAAPGADALHSLPMPAAWIYVVKDGRLVVPLSISGSKAAFAADVVTADNPIVGRIAFWTDDESCKLNLNTASEAAAWDMPAANTQVERGNALKAPVGVQSYSLSGHPAFTSLSPVLQNFGGAAAGSTQWPKPDEVNPMTADSSTPWARYVSLYQGLVPHGVGAGLITRQDRHYTTVDEFFYNPQRQPNGGGGSSGFLVEPADLGMARFFLTTHSAAPELNPFGGPKIALWMVPQDATQRTTVDRRVMAACTLNAGTPQAAEFAFQRASRWTSPTSQGSSQSMTDDWSLVARNQTLYAWLQQMSSNTMPGYGASFLGKYGAYSRDQLLTSMLDMLRWTANTSAYLPPGPGAANAQGLAEQSAVPLTLSTASGPTRGFGRFPTITEVAVVFAFTDVERGSDGKPRDDNQDGICDRATKLRAFLVVNPMLPACGTPAVSPAWSVRIRMLQHFTLGQGIGLLLPGGNVRNRCTVSSSLPLNGGAAWGGNTSAYECFVSQFLQADGTPKVPGVVNDPARGFPFISSGDVSLQSGMGMAGSTLRFSGGALVVDLMDPNAPLTPPQDGDAIHSVQMEFPDQVIPMPSLLVSDFLSGPCTINNRFTPVTVGTEMRLPIIQRGDVVRSLVLNPAGPSQGDVRLVAAQRELMLPGATNWYGTHPDYGTADTPANAFKAQAQSLRDGAYMLGGQFGSSGPGGSLQPTRNTAGTLLPGIAFADNAIPAVPVGMNGALPLGGGPALGDWESGEGVLEDGAFVSRSRLLPGACFTRSSTGGSIQPGSDPLGEISSAICFGALPSGVYGNGTDSTPRPWQTLLFCANPAGRSTAANQAAQASDHFGFTSPPDHLWLEFFWTPVTQPWPMSASFATEGKVNLNHQLMPFTWMQRATALYGALKGVRIPAIPTAALSCQNGSSKGNNDGSPLSTTFRYEVDEGKTVDGLNLRLDGGDVFRTASEICGQFLVPRRISGHAYDGGGFSPTDPASLQYSGMTTWWNGSAGSAGDAFEATGDNLRESPYAQLYPRLCTQSNVYCVHYRVQVLQQARGAPASTWDDTRDHLLADRRGSCVIERRLAPQASPLPDPASSSTARSLHEVQSLRIVSQTPFGP